MSTRFDAMEIARFLAELIRINTSNPPGNETPAAKLVAEKLSEFGIDATVVESSPGRGNVIARLKGSGEGPSLLLLSHLDVVPAKAEEWSVDPFAGVIKDGFVWGRGALDCKGAVAVELFVFAAMTKYEGRLRGDLIFAATADEEMGGYHGVGWLIKNRPELIKADYVINEGGGFSIPIKGRHVFVVQTAEKGVYWFRLRLRGKPGHASMPGAGENAVVRAAEAIERIARYRPPIVVTEHTRRFIETLCRAYGKPWLAKLLLGRLTADKVLDRMARRDKGLAEFLRAMLRNTMAPTIVRGGYKENIIPSDCELIVDCRLLPGYDERWVEQTLRRLLRGLDFELEFLKREPASESPPEGPLYDIIVRVLQEKVPGCLVTPYMVTGGTDSRFLRLAGAKAYGFIPLLMDLPFDEFMRMVHGVDERISLRNLEFGAEVLFEVVRRFMVG